MTGVVRWGSFDVGDGRSRTSWYVFSGPAADAFFPIEDSIRFLTLDGLWAVPALTRSMGRLAANQQAIAGIQRMGAVLTPDDGLAAMASAAWESEVAERFAVFHLRPTAPLGLISAALAVMVRIHERDAATVARLANTHAEMIRMMTITPTT